MQETIKYSSFTLECNGKIGGTQNKNSPFNFPTIFVFQGWVKAKNINVDKCCENQKGKHQAFKMLATPKCFDASVSLLE